MKIAAADSMREPVMAHFQNAGHGFELPGAQVFGKTESGHDIFMVRSPQLMEALQNGIVDMALVGTDVEHEMRLTYASRRLVAPAIHTLATFKGYGRQFITPTLDIVVHKNSGRDHIESGIIVATEHPFMLKDHLESLGFTTARIGDQGIPLRHEDFRQWAKDNAVHIGIHPVSGKAPALLAMELCDAATMVTESGRTVTDNGLVILETLEPIYVSLLATYEAVRRYAEGAVSFAEDLTKAYATSRQEFEMSRMSPERV